MKRIVTFVSFLGVALLLAGILRLVSFLPQIVESGTVRSYASLEAAQHALGVKELPLPTYFPQQVEWPPSEILAGRKPSPILIMHFRERGNKGGIILAVERASTPDPGIRTRLEPQQVLKTYRLELKGQAAEVALALCADGRPCNKITWQHGTERYSVLGRLPVDELRHIAESLVQAPLP